MNYTGALLGPKNGQKPHSLQPLSAKKDWERFYICIKEQAWNTPACALQKTPVPKRTIRHSPLSGLTEQSEGPLAYSASLLWHRFRDWFHYPLCYLFSSWKVPVTENSINETLCIRSYEWQNYGKKNLTCKQQDPRWSGCFLHHLSKRNEA